MQFPFVVNFWNSAYIKNLKSESGPNDCHATFSCRNMTILSLIRLWIPKNIVYIVFGILYLVCALTVILLSFKTYSAARGQINQIQEMELTVQQVAQNREMANVERLRKFAIAAIYVSLVFMVCYLPNMCTLWAIAITSEPVNTVIKHYTLTLVFLNSSVNPLIFCWKMRHIRHTVMNILRNACSSHNWTKSSGTWKWNCRALYINVRLTEVALLALICFKKKKKNPFRVLF